MNVNKVFLAGNLTRDPEAKSISSGQTLVQFSIASNRRWVNANGEKKEEVCFVDCVAWGKTGGAIKEHLHKGDPIFVEGRLRFDSWESNEGQRRSKLTVTVDNFQFVGGKREGGGSGPPSSAPPPVKEEYDAADQAVMDSQNVPF